MTENKTKKTNQSVKDFLGLIEDEKKRKDCFALLEMMRAVTTDEPKMWGDSMVGFGTYHYKYDSGREGDWFVTGFSPRKQNLTIYIIPGFDHYDDLMQKLGKHKTGKSCLYVKSLEEIDTSVLKKLIGQSVKHMAKSYK